MINLVLATFALALASVSEMLACAEQKRRVTIFGGSVTETAADRKMRIIRPLLIGAIVWFLSAQVERVAIQKEAAVELETGRR